MILLDIRGGGSVYSALNWANAWQESGHAVSLIVIQPDETRGHPFFVHPDIKVRMLDLVDVPVTSRLMALKRLLTKLYRLRRAIMATEADIIIAVDGPVNVLVLMACICSKTPVVIFEQVHPAHYSLGRFWEKWRERLYPHAAVLLNLTQSATDWCQNKFSLNRAMTIPNPVLPVSIKRSEARSSRRTITAAGRMVKQKRFDLLIQSFSLVADVHGDWDLIIYGDGPDRSVLEKLVADKGLSKRVRMPGWVADLSEKMAECDFFVLSSEYEGFGNVIVEAMAIGLPAISFDCEAGPSDIIRHGVDGLLVPPLDTVALADSMSQLMANDDFRKELGRRAPEVLDRFSLESTLEKWEELFDFVGVS